MIVEITNPGCDVEGLFVRFMNYYTNCWEPWFLDESVSEFLEHKRDKISDNTKCIINAWLQAGLIEKRKPAPRHPWHDERCWFLTQKGEEYWTKKNQRRKNDS